MNPNMEHILSRLQKVRGRNGSYSACCPAHEDRSPSLTIRETPDGTILLHCFSGCSVNAIAEAVGVELTDLFPPESEDYKAFDARNRKPVRPKFYASELLRAISFEATVVAVAAHNLAAGKALSKTDLDRLTLAKQRITEALEASK